MELITFDNIVNMNISPKTCVEWAQEVIIKKKECILPPKISIHFGENDNSFFNTMPSFIPFMNRFGVKEVSRLPERKPSLQADILLYDTKTGNLLTFMDGTWITTMRTGAVAAITAEKLKPSFTKEYSFIGLGNTARATLLCLNAINMKENLKINILAYKDQHISFMERFKDFSNLQFNVYTNVKDMIKISDVIFSCVTTADCCFAEPECFKTGVLVVPVHTRGFQNCDLVFDKIYCDDIGHISGFKYFNEYKYVAELTDVLNDKNFKRNDEDRLLAYNIGISLQDVFFASKIFDVFSNKLASNDEKFWV